jgi:hypothetical protein
LDAAFLEFERRVLFAPKLKDVAEDFEIVRAWFFICDLNWFGFVLRELQQFVDEPIRHRHWF